MSARAARVAVLVLLLAVGGGGAVAVWAFQARIGELDLSAADVEATLDRLQAAVDDLVEAQQSYVNPGRGPGEAFARVAGHLGRIQTDTAALDARTRSPAGADQLAAFADAVERFVRIDAGIRESLRLDSRVLASDMIAGSSRDVADSLRRSLRALRTAERQAAWEGRAGLVRRQWETMAATAFIWLLGLLYLARSPRGGSPAATGAAAPMPLTGTEEVREVNLPVRSQEPPSLDLAAAAEICREIARVTETAALSDILARAAGVLDASGLVVWIAHGDELYAVSAFGYDARVLARLGAISRDADNATAAAWRTGQLQTVRADSIANGAIVAPMIGPTACLGVLAVEIRHGRESEAPVQAVTSMMAAQLATVFGTADPLDAQGAHGRGITGEPFLADAPGTN